MKILCMSDTHSKHLEIQQSFISNLDNEISMVIHSGDISMRGSKQEVIGFLNWFSKLNFKYKILIAGNHDFFFERPKEEIDEVLSMFPDIIYLNDSGVEIEGFKIWGSPVQPWFYNWAFNRRETEIKHHWNMIPLDTEILITHGPIYDYLDKNADGKNTGCIHLLEKVTRLSELKLHVCGHIHEAYGRIENDQTTFVNASLLNLRYMMTNEPIIVEIKK